MTLFDEIAGNAPKRPLTPNEAVAVDVERICRSRRGTLLIAPEYGIDDVSSLFHSFPMIDAWAGNLERTLMRYEPRLRNVHVTPVVTEEADLTLRADIQAALVTGDRPTAARFTATLDSRSRLSVR